MRWLVVCAVLIACAAAGGGALTVGAQAPPSSPTAVPAPPPSLTPSPRPTAPLGPPSPVRLLADGDLLWAFAGEPPLTDERVQLALATVVLSALDAGGFAGGRSDFMIHRAPGLTRGTGVRTTPRDQLPLLLRAAGIGPATLSEVGRCVVSVLPPPVGVTPVVPPAEAARRLGEAVREGLRELGVTVQACASGATGAQIVAWYAGGPEPALPIRPRATWLTAPGLEGLRPAQAGPVVGPSLLPRVPGAPATGNAGVARDGTAGASLLIGALFASIAGARWLTGRERWHGTRRG
jgi:hypothetical protein